MKRNSRPAIFERSTLIAGGFALLEALIAAAVIAFGLFAIARLQATLFGNSDVAKQRTEAVTLGEKKIEELRAYAQLPTDTATPARRAYQDIVSSNDTVAGTSASYTRTWTITDVNPAGAAYAMLKDVRMRVTWTSRTNGTEAVELNSIIALSDPNSSGLTSVPPSGLPTRKPKNRDINIPFPAVRLGGGISGFHPPGSASGMAIIFDDITGYVTQTCTSASLPGSDVTSGTTNTSSWGCTMLTGVVFAGYITLRPDNSSLPGVSAPPINFHLSLAMTGNSGGSSGTATLFGCFDDIGSSGTGTQLYTGYVTYICVVDTGSSGGAWSGTASFSGTTFPPSPVTVTWGNSSSQWRMCRFVQTGGQAYPYSNVSKSLESQNFSLVRGNDNFNPGNIACPSGSTQVFP